MAGMLGKVAAGGVKLMLKRFFLMLAMLLSIWFAISIDMPQKSGTR